MTKLGKLSIIVAVCLYVMAWFDVAQGNFVYAAFEGLFMFVLVIGASHSKTLDTA
jgi:hypothetical protein